MKIEEVCKCKWGGFLYSVVGKAMNWLHFVIHIVELILMIPFENGDQKKLGIHSEYWVDVYTQSRLSQSHIFQMTIVR